MSGTGAPPSSGEAPGPNARAVVASGTLLYRRVAGALEILLVHPAGNFNRRAPWGIPKGAPEPGEALEAAARRETMEETGLSCGALVDVGFIDYTRSRKRVHAYAGPAPADAVPRCASWEVDQVEFIELSRARRIIHPDQAALLGRLERLLAGELEAHDEAGDAARAANSNARHTAGRDTGRDRSR
ncbi:MAG: NUDIX domain-containing protein [Kofleriaceae bacterium]